MALHICLSVCMPGGAGGGGGCKPVWLTTKTTMIVFDFCLNLYFHTLPDLTRCYPIGNLKFSEKNMEENITQIHPDGIKNQI